MNSCHNCRWLKITSSEYTDVGYFNCKKHYKLHPLFSKIIMPCDDWEQGGLKGWFQRLRKRWNYITMDPLKDPRCQGCAHIDGPICPYPDECSAMLKNQNNHEKSSIKH